MKVLQLFVDLVFFLWVEVSLFPEKKRQDKTFLVDTLCVFFVIGFFHTVYSSRSFPSPTRVSAFDWTNPSSFQRKLM